MKSIGIDILAIVVFLTAMFIASCGKPPAAAPTTRPAAPTVALVGGLEESQLTNRSPSVHDVASAAGVQIVNFGTPNGYLADVGGYFAKNSTGPLIGIAHSMGCKTVCDTGVAWRKLILIDPAGTDPMTVPAGVDCLVIRCDTPTPFITPSKVFGTFREIHVPPSHNAAPHDWPTLTIIENEIKAAIAPPVEAQ